MLVGISGKISSGKDTLAKLIMEQFIKVNYPHTRIEALAIQGYEHLSKCKVVKFADKLKDIVCVLTGCARYELESQEFKNSLTHPMWNRTAKEAREWLIWRDFSNGKDTGYGAKDDQEITRIAIDAGFRFERTYREMLQEIGTDLFREKFHPLTWVNATFADWKLISTESRHWMGHAISMVDPEPDIEPRWIITDVRFPDEAEAIKKRGGLLFRINRPSVDNTMHGASHASETALDKYDGFDTIIENNGTLEDFRRVTVDIVNKFNLR